MGTLLSRYKNVLVFLGAMVLQFIALAVQVRTPSMGVEEGAGQRLLRHWMVAMMARPEKAVVATGSETRGLWGSYVDLRNVREENERLRDEVYQLRLEQASLLEDARQGQRLQALLGFRERYVSQTTPAQVIGTAGSEEARVLYIDKGAQDGLAAEQPVITPDGIVGKIKEVFPHTAQVLEINDQTSGAGVLLQATRLRGVLRGNMYGQPQIINILPDERIKPGEPVVTSGGDQIFPRGLPVGTVEKVVADPERDPYVDVVIKPAANLSHLEEVLVVTGTSDTLSAKARRDLERSQAVGAAEMEKERASDILAEKLPGIVDPNAPEEAENDSGEQKATGEEVGRPIQPPQPLHADRFSPNAAPPAIQLTPGKAPVIAATATLAQSGRQTAITRAPARPEASMKAPGVQSASAVPPGSAAKGGSVRTSAGTQKASFSKPATGASTMGRTEPVNLTGVSSGQIATHPSVADRALRPSGAEGLASPGAERRAPAVASARSLEPGGMNLSNPPALKSAAAIRPAPTQAGTSGKLSSAKTPARPLAYTEPKWVGRKDLPQEQPQ